MSDSSAGPRFDPASSPPSLPVGGCLITFEGGEGAGKSTVIPTLRARLEATGREVVVTREPGGTPLGERIRGLLLDPAGDAPGPEAEALLFCAARSELVRRVLRPALERGAVVLCDRYADSTLAYQGYGRGLPLERLHALNAVATGGLRPHLTLLLDLSVAEGMARRRDDVGDLDRLDSEARSFHERVHAGFLALASAEPERWTVLDATRTPATVAEDAWTAALASLGPSVGAGDSASARAAKGESNADDRARFGQERDRAASSPG